MTHTTFQGYVYVLLWTFIHQSLVSGIIEVNGPQGNDILYILNIGNLTLSVGKNVILQSNLRNRETEPPFLVELGTNYNSKWGLPVLCDYQRDSVCLNWNGKAQVKVKRLNDFCHEVAWNSTVKVEDCVSYGGANWYGGPELDHQVWPVEAVHLKHVPYVTSFDKSMGVVEPYWFNSKGLLLVVHYDVPLFVDSNNDKNNSLCFISNAVYPYNSIDRNRDLKYTVCQLDDARKSREYAVQQNIIGKPSNIPDTRMVEYPVWSTWVQFYSHINATTVLDYAKSVIKYGFNNSQIEIDDKWETCYGSKTIDKERFPDMKNLSSQLKKLGFRITLWTHPFVNFGCSNYSILNAKGLFVSNSKGFKTVKWWDGVGSVYDFTKPATQKWFQDVHRDLLEEYGFDGYKFDAGECKIIPKNSKLRADPNNYPKAYTSAYIDTLSAFGGITETRVSGNSSNYPIYVRMLDKSTSWDLDNGLRSLITTCLLMNIQGYPWVLPDMVGGNAYGHKKVTEELFIRWLQANTFMPVIQFSYAPWNFNNQVGVTCDMSNRPVLACLLVFKPLYPNIQTVIDITKKFTTLHYSYSGKIIELMKKTVETGVPLNPPIWWIDPNDNVALAIDTEYLLGEEILVAPVLEENARKRDVYLPRGSWQDGNNASNIIQGPCWVKEYPADLSTLPYFINVNSI